MTGGGVCGSDEEEKGLESGPWGQETRWDAAAKAIRKLRCPLILGQEFMKVEGRRAEIQVFSQNYTNTELLKNK